MTMQLNQPQLNQPQPSANREEILKTAEVLYPEGAVVEVRALDASTPDTRAAHTEYGYFKDIEKLADAVVWLSQYAPVVYISLNEIDERLWHRTADKLASEVRVSKKATTTCDKDITRFRYLLVDCDPKRPSDISASDEEHQWAKERAKEVYRFLKSFGFPEPVWADSGNGIHLLYRIDLEHTPESATLVKQVLSALSFRFSDDKVIVDESVATPARISKMYGTVAASKGANTAERPHRKSALLKWPKSLHTKPATLAQLQAVAATLPEMPKPERKTSKGSAGTYHMEGLIEQHPDVLAVRREGAWGDKGYKWLLECCPFDESHTDNSAVLTLVYGVPGFRCQHNSCLGKDIKALWGLLGEKSKSERSAKQEAHAEQLEAAAPPTPTWFSAEELLAQEFSPVKWAVRCVLPEGTSLLAGKPKMGKSWMAMGLAVAVASGTPALGSAEVERGDVLYLALEDNKRRLQERVKIMLAGKPIPKGLTFDIRCPRTNAGGLEYIESWLKLHPDARLIIVDTLAKVRAPARTTQGIYEADYQAVEGLKRLSDEYRVTLLVITHLRKSKSEDGDVTDEISGSTGLTGGVDGTLVLKRERGQVDAVLHITGRDVEEAALAMQFNHDTCTWTLAGPAEDFIRSKERADILRVLRELGGQGRPSEVAAALGKDANTVQQRMWRMGNAGELRVVSRGVYALPIFTYNDDKEGNVRKNGKDDNEAKILADAGQPYESQETPIRFANPGSNGAQGTNRTNLIDLMPHHHVAPSLEAILAQHPLQSGEDPKAWQRRILVEYDAAREKASVA